MKKLTLLLIPIFFCCLTCDTKPPPEPKPDPEPELPPATTTGANTFGMLVNGEVWLPKIDPPVFAKPSLGLSYHQGKLNLFARRDLQSSETYENFVINYTTPSASRIIEIGDYQLLEWRIYGGAFFKHYHTQCDYETDTTNTGMLTITRLDTINGIISGTFEVPVLVNKDTTCPDTLRITEGRFDINYH